MTVQEFFEKNNKAAVALSGGLKSTYVLFSAVQAGADVQPYFVKTAFCGASALEDAECAANECCKPLKVIELDLDAAVLKNGTDRCALCKSRMTEAIRTAAMADGYDLLLDGADGESDCPSADGVLSPLKLCGIDRTVVAELAEQAGLSASEQFADSCLAARIETGMPIERDLLQAVSAVEDALLELGFVDLRLEIAADGILLRVRREQAVRVHILQKEIDALMQAHFPNKTYRIKAR